MVDGSVRMNITVPAALKKRMDGVKERVNWSAIASRAFETEIDRIHKQREIEGMNEIAKRLRETKREAEAKKDAMYAEGFEAGKDWAANRAKAIELENMYDNYINKLGGKFDETNECNRVRWDTDNIPVFMLYVLAGGAEVCEYGDFTDRTGIWRDVEEHELKDYIREAIGFAEGAMAVWEEVKDQI